MSWFTKVSQVPSLKSVLESLRPQIVAAAQKALDDWQPNEEGWDETLGSGGACDEINWAIKDILAGAGIDNMDGGQEGDDHAYCIAYNDEEAYLVDIPCGIYSRVERKPLRL